MCTQKKNHEKRIKKKEIFAYVGFFLYLCTVIQFVRKSLTQAGTEYISLAQNSERVADHLINVAKTIRNLQ